MSQPRSRLIAEVYSYCGEPADAPLKKNGLPQELVFQVLCENEDEMLRDLNLSSESRRVSKEEVPLQDGTEVTLNIDAHSAAYVQLQTDPSTDLRWPVEIVKPSALLQAASDRQLAIAFHDNLQIAELSWEPDANQILTVWYDRSGDDFKTKAGSTEIGNLYDSYLKLRTAAQCRELMNLPIGDVLKSRLARSEEQWRRNVNRGQQKGTGYKSRVFTPLRFRRPVAVDRTRFFVP